MILPQLVASGGVAHDLKSTTSPTDDEENTRCGDLS